MKELYKALLAAQTEIKAISKDETNPFFNSKYFDINALIAAVKPILQGHGLAVIQPLSHIDGKPAIKTILIHADSGQSLEEVTPLPTVTEKTSQTNPKTGKLVETAGTNAQGMGSAITYYRRYALQSLLLLESKEDDDGAAASGTTQQTNKDFF